MDALPLSDAAIDRALTRTSAGTYTLGYLQDGVFVVFYVGRADHDLRQCLHDWVGIPGRYARYAPAGKAAWSSRPSGGLLPFGRPTLGPVGVIEDAGYTHFAYRYARSAQAAYRAECRDYLRFGGRQLDNEAAPEIGQQS